MFIYDTQNSFKSLLFFLNIETSKSANNNNVMIQIKKPMRLNRIKIKI